MEIEFLIQIEFVFSDWLSILRLILWIQKNYLDLMFFDSKLTRWFLHSSIPEELSIPRRILQFMYNTIFKSNFCKWKTAISHIFIVFSRFVGVYCCSGGCQSIDEDTVEVKPRASKEVTGTCYLKHLLNHLLKSSPKVS